MLRLTLLAVLALLCQAMSGCLSSTTIEEDTDVYYLDALDVPCIVLIHGWACSWGVWMKQMPLAHHVRVIALDLPGHGESEEPEGEITMDLFAESVAAVLDQADIHRAIVVGHSNGAPVARQFYRRYPDRTAGIAIVDGALRSFFSDPSAGESFVERMSGPDRMEFLEPFVDSMMPDVEPEFREGLRATMLTTPERVQVASFRASLDPAIWEPDPIDVPLLSVLAESPFWTEEYEQFVRSLAPDVEYHMMSDVGHFLMMERPEEFNALLLEWAQRVWIHDRHPEPSTTGTSG